MPSAFIWIEKQFHKKTACKKIKKILGTSKAIRIFESPLLCIWQFECSVHIFRGPWVVEEIDVIKLLDTESKNLQCSSERCQKRHLTIKHSMKKRASTE